MPKIVAAVRQDAAKRVLFTQLAKNSSTANCNVAAALVMLCVDAIDKNMGAGVGAAVADSGDSDPVADMSSEDARAEQAKSAQEAVQSWSTVCGTIIHWTRLPEAHFRVVKPHMDPSLEQGSADVRAA
jgi:hypothetical protein